MGAYECEIGFLPCAGRREQAPALRVCESNFLCGIIRAGTETCPYGIANQMQIAKSLWFVRSRKDFAQRKHIFAEYTIYILYCYIS